MSVYQRVHSNNSNIKLYIRSVCFFSGEASSLPLNIYYCCYATDAPYYKYTINKRCILTSCSQRHPSLFVATLASLLSLTAFSARSCSVRLSVLASVTLVPAALVVTSSRGAYEIRKFLNWGGYIECKELSDNFS